MRLSSPRTPQRIRPKNYFIGFWGGQLEPAEGTSDYTDTGRLRGRFRVRHRFEYASTCEFIIEGTEDERPDTQPADTPSISFGWSTGVVSGCKDERIIIIIIVIIFYAVCSLDSLLVEPISRIQCLASAVYSSRRVLIVDEKQILVDDQCFGTDGHCGFTRVSNTDANITIAAIQGKHCWIPRHVSVMRQHKQATRPLSFGLSHIQWTHVAVNGRWWAAMGESGKIDIFIIILNSKRGNIS